MVCSSVRLYITMTTVAIYNLCTFISVCCILIINHYLNLNIIINKISITNIIISCIWYVVIKYTACVSL